MISNFMLINQTLELLTAAHGVTVMKKFAIFEWHKKFKRIGRCEVMIGLGFRKLMRLDRSLNTQVMAEELNLKREAIRKILTEDLKMRKFPRILC